MSDDRITEKQAVVLLMTQGNNVNLPTLNKLTPGHVVDLVLVNATVEMCNVRLKAGENQLRLVIRADGVNVYDPTPE